MIPRPLAAAILAIPVLAAVYLRAAVGSRSGRRIGLAAGLSILIAATAVATSRPSSGSATRDGSPTPPAEASGLALAAPSGGPEVVALGAPASSVRPAAAATIEPTVERTGETALAASALPPPSVVRFRPRNGSTGVGAPLEVSVRFSQPMDATATTPAFRVMVDGTAWAGRARWAEARTVLVVRLVRRPPAGATVRLLVSGAARSLAGTAIATPVAATFTVAPRPASRPTPSPAAATRSAAPPVRTSSGWAWPLLGPITQRFGESLTKYGFHQGIDIDGDTGDPVRAAAAGRVSLAGTGDSCGGIQVRIDHGGGLETWYRHLSAVSVKTGQRVDRGQVVGKVGATGCALGSHLHFAVRRDGTFVDPLRYLPPR